MNNTDAYAVQSATDALAPFTFQRRDVQPDDVQIDILYCGVCHSDIHQARNEWGSSIYRMVPGHEIVGRVTKTGDQVTKFKAGELVGVGCFVDSCRECPHCKANQEQYCEKGMSPTYNGSGATARISMFRRAQDCRPDAVHTKSICGMEAKQGSEKQPWGVIDSTQSAGRQPGP